MKETKVTRGRFITLEGVEGSGKTSQMERLQGFLMAAGIEVIRTREPGGTPLGEATRTLLLDPDLEICADAELLAIFAARAEHLHRVIVPALDAGKWVLSDRFTDATYAYQGGGRGIPDRRIEAVEQWVQGDLRPDLVLVLDLPVAFALARVRQRGQGRDRFEREESAFFNRAREIYLRRAQDNPNYRVVPADGTLHEVTHALITSLRTMDWASALPAASSSEVSPQVGR